MRLGLRLGRFVGLMSAFVRRFVDPSNGQIVKTCSGCYGYAVDLMYKVLLSIAEKPMSVLIAGYEYPLVN